MRVTFNDTLFQKEMNNIIDYSLGFLDGVKLGKQKFLKNLGEGTIEVLKQYIDSHAKMNPEMLHHVYEWYQIGSPNARLYDLSFTISNLGLSIKSQFKKSQSLARGSTTPFLNKAQIMELGKTVKVTPKNNGVLAFEDDGESVFTKKEVTIKNPGGDNVAGSYQKVFDEFFNIYFRQSLLRASGLYDYISKPSLYKKNLAAGAKAGRPKGLSTGYTWIANATIGVER